MAGILLPRSGRRNSSVLGEVSNSRACEEPLVWELKSLYYTRLQVRFDPD